MNPTRLLNLFVTLLLTCGLAAQEDFAALQRRFRQQAQELAAQSPSREQQTQLLTRHVEELSRFVAASRGDDHWNARLMLADLQLAGGLRDAARSTLAALDPAQVRPLLLVSATLMARHVGLHDRGQQWLEAACSKESETAERLAIARLLCVSLHEVERGERVFADELRKAKDDEARALVRFHRADAMRDREDLPDNAGWEELDRLAKDLPDSYWGGVAADRSKAVQLRVGDAALPFSVTTLDGKALSQKDAMGKVLVLAFWVLGDADNAALWAELNALHKQHGEHALIVAICLDREVELARAALAQANVRCHAVVDGKGILGDAAARWFVEGPGLYVCNRAGKLTGLRLFLGTADGRADWQTALTNALR